MKDALASGLDIPGIPLASPLNVLVSFSCVCLLVAHIVLLPRSPSRPPLSRAQAQTHYTSRYLQLDEELVH